MHLVSVILPTYNRASMLEEAILSVLNQTYGHFELLIIDDGSNDETDAVVSSFADSRIRYTLLEHSGKISQLRNKGIRMAKGNFIAFLDSDDLWHSSKLEQQLALLEAHPEAGFSVTDVTTVRGEEVLIDRSFPCTQRTACINLFPELTGNRFIVYGSVLLVRRPCLDKTGFYPENQHDGDLLLNMMLAYHYKAAIIYEPLTTRRLHDTNISEQMPMEYYGEYLFTFATLYKDRLITRRRWKQAQSLAHIKMGQICQKNGERRASIYHYTSALKNNLFYPRHVLLLVRTLFKT